MICSLCFGFSSKIVTQIRKQKMCEKTNSAMIVKDNMSTNVPNSKEIKSLPKEDPFKIIEETERDGEQTILPKKEDEYEEDNGDYVKSEYDEEDEEFDDYYDPNAAGEYDYVITVLPSLIRSLGVVCVIDGKEIPVTEGEIGEIFDDPYLIGQERSAVAGSGEGEKNDNEDEDDC